MDDRLDRRFRRKPSIIFAIFMIAAGIVLFLANLGLFPIHRVWALWPLVFSAIGFSRLAHYRRPSSLLISIVFIVIGIVATLFNFDVFHLRLHDDTWPIALILIAVGLTGLARTLDGEPWTFGSRRSPFARLRFSDSSNPGTEAFLSDHTFMGNIKRKVESQDFEGGKLSTTMGNIKLDLRRARMPEGKRTARLEVHTIMGNVTLRIPESWSIRWDGENIMGNFQDKTIPPNTGADAPQLLLTGSCTMGSIEIEN